MRSGRKRAERGVALAGLLLLAACAGTPKPAPRPAPPAATGAVKIGKPYQVLGKTYVPADDRGYDERGIASWYGPGFHALSTANGERYDQDGLSAAHKTLPMPSYVEVENLDNGRRLTVRINDRGPFVDGRIIDLSRRAAQLLGVDRPGTARVRVRRVFPDGAEIAALAPPKVTTPAPAPLIVAASPVPVAAAPALPPPVATVAIPGAAPVPVPLRAGQNFVQVAALADPGRIAWLTGYLGAFGPVVTERTPAGLTRLRLGPYNDVDSAVAVLAKLRSAGYTDSRLVEVAPAP